MLSSPVADLVLRDPAIPGLATLLDTEALVARLRRHLPGVDLGTARVTYVKYKPGTNCLVSYRVEMGGTAIDVYAKAYRPDAQAQLAKAREQTGKRRKILQTLINARTALREAREAEGYELLPHDLQDAFAQTLDAPLSSLSEKLYQQTFAINRRRVRMALKNYAFVRGVGEDIDWREIS